MKSNGEKRISETVAENGDAVCFAIMPISDPEGYSKGHFRRVYEDIVAPACTKAGFRAIRADDVTQTNLIHLDILQKLLDAPMAVCDLSSHNPNVLFELALRQAFDKPVTLIQELDTAPIFDISPFRLAQYRKDRVYHEVLEDQGTVAAAIRDTYKAHQSGHGVNSIVRLLGLEKSAFVPDINTQEASMDVQRLILSELSRLREDVQSIKSGSKSSSRADRDKWVDLTSRMIRSANAVEKLLHDASTSEQLHAATRELEFSREVWTALMNDIPSLDDQYRSVLLRHGRYLDELESKLLETRTVRRE